MPTPAVAFLTRSLRADLGVMISASHNPYHDNGIKLFGPDGFKLSDEIEVEIEALMAATPDERLGRPRRSSAGPGGSTTRAAATSRTSRAASRKGLTLNGLKIVVDSAHGAAYHLAADLFFELGAEVIRLGTEPNGLNINDGCGSTAAGGAARGGAARAAPISASRSTATPTGVVLVDERGSLIDGDQVLALIAAQLAARTGACAARRVVATVMSNLGLEQHLGGLGPRRCSGPRSATATWSSGCAPTAAMSAASSPATSC